MYAKKKQKRILPQRLVIDLISNQTISQNCKKKTKKKNKKQKTKHN